MTMNKLFRIVALIIAALFLNCTNVASVSKDVSPEKNILTGADQVDQYIPLLKGKRVAILANQTSIIGKTHLVDSLKSLGINIVKVFGPEHGFRGNASAGTSVGDEKDGATGIPIISLYGKKINPQRRT